MKVLHNHTLSTQLGFAQREMAYGGTVLIMKVILHNTKNQKTFMKQKCYMFLGHFNN